MVGAVGGLVSRHNVEDLRRGPVPVSLNERYPGEVTPAAESGRIGRAEPGRPLLHHLSKVRRTAEELKKRDYIAKYIPKISEALQGILEFDDRERDRTTAQLTDILNRSRKP